MSALVAIYSFDSLRASSKVFACDSEKPPALNDSYVLCVSNTANAIVPSRGRASMPRITVPNARMEYNRHRQKPRAIGVS